MVNSRLAAFLDFEGCLHGPDGLNSTVDLLTAPRLYELRKQFLWGNKLFPDIPNSPVILPIIWVLFIWRALVMAICLFIFFVPLYRGGRIRRKHFWLIRGRYLPSSRSAYCVPNQALVIPVSEFFASIAHQVLLYGTYRSFKNLGFAVRPGFTTLLGVSWLLSHIGSWMAGWGVYNAYLLAKSRHNCKSSTKVMGPLLYNSLWMSWLIAVISINAYWSWKMFKLALKIRQSVRLRTDLLSAIFQDSDEEPILTNSVSSGLIELSSQTKLAQAWHRTLSSHLQSWSMIWVAIGVVIALFHVFMVRQLLKLIKYLLSHGETERLATALGNHHQRTFVIDDAVGRPPKLPSASEPMPAADALQLELLFFMRNSVFMTIFLVLQITSSIVSSFACARLCSRTWRSFAAFMGMIPMLLSSPCLLLQAWWICKEKNVTEEPRIPNKAAPSDSSQPRYPLLSSHLRDWFISPPECDAGLGSPPGNGEVNFPGFEVAIQHIRNRVTKDDDAAPRPNFDELNLDLSQLDQAPSLKVRCGRMAFRKSVEISGPPRMELDEFCHSSAENSPTTISSPPLRLRLGGVTVSRSVEIAIEEFIDLDSISSPGGVEQSPTEVYSTGGV